jgi:hypothetical protein
VTLVYSTTGANHQNRSKGLPHKNCCAECLSDFGTKYHESTNTKTVAMYIMSRHPKIDPSPLPSIACSNVHTRTDIYLTTVHFWKRFTTCPINITWFTALKKTAAQVLVFERLWCAAPREHKHQNGSQRFTALKNCRAGFECLSDFGAQHHESTNTKTGAKTAAQVLSV